MNYIWQTLQRLAVNMTLGNSGLTLNVYSNDPNGVQGCCWMGDLKNLPDASNTNIRFFTEIDLTPRPNTAAVNPNEINTSPVTDIIPVLPARTGCEHRLFIPNADPDFDSVRCRWAESNSDIEKDECGGVCHALNMAPFNGRLNEVSSVS